MAEQIVSFLPSEMVAGGLVNDIDVTYGNCRFDIYNFGERGDFCSFVADLDDGEGEEHEQAWSVGGDGSFAPSEDGKYLVQVGDRTKLVKSSNFGLLMQEFRSVGGLDESKLFTGKKLDISKLNGTKAHVLRKKAKGRSDIVDEGEDGRQRGSEYLGVTDVYSWGYDGKKGGRGGSKKAATATKKASAKAPPESGEGESDSEDVATELVIANLTEAGGAKELADLELETYQASKGRGNPTFRKEVREYVKDAEWLAALDNVVVDADAETAELSG